MPAIFGGRVSRPSQKDSVDRVGIKETVSVSNDKEDVAENDRPGDREKDEQHGVQDAPARTLAAWFSTSRSESWNDPYGYWAAIGYLKLLGIGVAVWGLVALIFAMGWRVQHSHLTWVVPALNYAGSVLLAVGILTQLTNQLKVLGLAASSIVFAALPYFALRTRSAPLALIAGPAIGIGLIIVVGIGVLGAAKPTPGPHSSFDATRAADRTTRADTTSLVATTCAVSGILALTVAFCASLLPTN